MNDGDGVAIGGMLSGLAVLMGAGTAWWAARATASRSMAADFEARRSAFIGDLERSMHAAETRIAAVEAAAKAVAAAQAERIARLESDVSDMRSGFRLIREVASMGGPAALLRITEIATAFVGAIPDTAERQGEVK